MNHLDDFTRYYSVGTAPTAQPTTGSLVTGGQTSYARCRHDARTPVFTLDEGKPYALEVYGVESYEADRMTAPQVYLNLSDTGKFAPPRLGRFSNLAHLLHTEIEEVMLPWPDGGLPKVDPRFWGAFRHMCGELNIQRLAIGCMMAHGRTGTAMAALLVEAKWRAKDAIEFVRKVHCEKAVETAGQVAYLFELDSILNKVPVLGKDQHQILGSQERSVVVYSSGNGGGPVAEAGFRKRNSDDYPEHKYELRASDFIYREDAEQWAGYELWGGIDYVDTPDPDDRLAECEVVLCNPQDGDEVERVPVTDTAGLRIDAILAGTWKPAKKGKGKKRRKNVGRAARQG